MPLHVIVFLVLSLLFAWTHQIAVAGSLYWYYWWFDIFMHLWGGGLLAFGVHALCRLPSVQMKPRLPLVLVVITGVVVVWEIFEYSVGLFDPNRIVAEAVQDIGFGYLGGLLTHFAVRAFTMKSV